MFKSNLKRLFVPRLAGWVGEAEGGGVEGAWMISFEPGSERESQEGPEPICDTNTSLVRARGAGRGWMGVGLGEDINTVQINMITRYAR